MNLHKLFVTGAAIICQYFLSLQFSFALLHSAAPAPASKGVRNESPSDI